MTPQRVRVLVHRVYDQVAEAAAGGPSGWELCDHYLRRESDQVAGLFAVVSMAPDVADKAVDVQWLITLHLRTAAACLVTTRTPSPRTLGLTSRALVSLGRAACWSAESLLVGYARGRADSARTAPREAGRAHLN